MHKDIKWANKEIKGLSLDVLNKYSVRYLESVENANHMNSVLTYEQRSEAKKIKISKDIILEAMEGEMFHGVVAKKLDIAMATYRRLCQEYDIWDILEEPIFTCEFCGKEDLDVGNYTQAHGENCQWKMVTKEMILEAHSKFECAVDCWEYLGLSRKVYIRFCEQFKLESKFADIEKRKQISSDKNSRGLNVWKYDSTKSDGKGEFIGLFKSLSLAANALDTNRVYIDDCIKKRYPNAKPKYIFEKLTH